MNQKYSYLGEKFGRLTVTSEEGRHVICSCECGTIGHRVSKSNLKYHSQKSCGCLRNEKARERMQRADAHPRGELSHAWKGLREEGTSRSLTHKGYVRVHNISYPGANCPNDTMEHIAIMCRILGRPLVFGETVHHKNGVRNDNRPDNLELRVGAHQQGLTIEEAVEWAKDILARYQK